MAREQVGLRWHEALGPLVLVATMLQGPQGPSSTERWGSPCDSGLCGCRRADDGVSGQKKGLHQAGIELPEWQSLRLPAADVVPEESPPSSQRRHLSTAHLDPIFETVTKLSIGGGQGPRSSHTDSLPCTASRTHPLFHPLFSHFLALLCPMAASSQSLNPLSSTHDDVLSDISVLSTNIGL